jgi:hypothetical protein
MINSTGDKQQGPSLEVSKENKGDPSSLVTVMRQGSLIGLSYAAKRKIQNTSIIPAYVRARSRLGIVRQSDYIVLTVMPVLLALTVEGMRFDRCIGLIVSGAAMANESDRTASGSLSKLAGLQDLAAYSDDWDVGKDTPQTGRKDKLNKVRNLWGESDADSENSYATLPA